jgi:hypothetical protein
LSEFYEEWKEEPLVILKWLALVAGSNLEGNVARVQDLLTHPAFVITNPNNCYSVFLGFARSHVNFHAVDGSGYNFLADSILKVRSRLRDGRGQTDGVHDRCLKHLLPMGFCIGDGASSCVVKEIVGSLGVAAHTEP